MNQKNQKIKKEKNNTSWGSVASWYDKHLEKSGDTYHEKVVYPNVLRLIDLS